MVAEELAGLVPAGLCREDEGRALRAAFGGMLSMAGAGDDRLLSGGVFAMVGPTGSGKTTMTAKLAARCAISGGRGSVALVSTDNRRAGAREQLKAYGAVLGIEVRAARDSLDLRNVLADVSWAESVFIDTPGVSQRDKGVGEQTAMLTGAGVFGRVLMLNASSGGDTLDEVAAAYGGEGLAGCVLTKTDEAVSLAPALGVAAARKLRILSVSNGQRVPDDLHSPNPAYLVHRALKAVLSGDAGGGG